MHTKVFTGKLFIPRRVSVCILFDQNDPQEVLMLQIILNDLPRPSPPRSFVSPIMPQYGLVSNDGHTFCFNIFDRQTGAYPAPGISCLETSCVVARANRPQDSTIHLSYAFQHHRFSGRWDTTSLILCTRSFGLRKEMVEFEMPAVVPYSWGCSLMFWLGEPSCSLFK